MASDNSGSSGAVLYKYPSGEAIKRNTATWLRGISGLGFIALGVSRILSITRGGDVILMFIGFVALRLFSLTRKTDFELTRPIVINDTEISALLFGKAWRTLPWSQVDSIERIRFYSPAIHTMAYKVHVAGDGVDIWMDDNILGFDALLADLTKRAQEHQIDLGARDRGRDTLAKIKAEVADAQERKRLLKTGIVTTVDSLDIDRQEPPTSTMPTSTPPAGVAMAPADAGGPGAVLYKFDPGLAVMWAVIFGASLAMGLGFVACGVSPITNTLGVSVTFVFLGLVSLCLFFWFPGQYKLERTRSIIVSDTGISALLRGKTWRSLPWSKVISIERIRFYSQDTYTMNYQVHVAGDGVDIWADPNVLGFEALLADLTKRAHEHDIELLTRDRGPDTYRKIKAEVSDPLERKRLLKTGIVTTVDTLVLPPGKARR